MNIKIWDAKETKLFFCVTQKWNFIFYDTWLYFCCYVTTKIHHHDMYFKQFPKQKFDVARKTILCRNKKFDVAQKVIWFRSKQVGVTRRIVLRQTKKSWCCTKNKMMLHKKIILCSKKLKLFSETTRHRPVHFTDRSIYN